MLKNSIRNSKSRRSLAANLVLLNREKSELSTPSERRLGSTRGSFPKVKSGGAAKQEGLNHRGALRLFGSPSFVVAAPDADAGQPDTRFGREPPPKSVVPLSCPFVKTRGNPRWKMVTPSTPHPPIILSAISVTPERNFLPLPNGRSRTKLTTKRWGTSCEESERSPRRLLLFWIPPTPVSSHEVSVSVSLMSFELV